MKRYHGLLALTVPALLLFNLFGEQTTPEQRAPASQPTRPANVAAQVPLSTVVSSQATTASSARSEPLPASWRAMPDELSQQLASEVSDSDLPLAERLANLEGAEARWLGEGESLYRLQGRYALALEELAQESEQLPLAERLDALSRLQDQWAADHPDLAGELFNPDARLQQARQLWGDEELPTLARHFLPADRAEATVQFAANRQQQLDQRSRYQQQLAALEQQLIVAQGTMAPTAWQQYREEQLSRFRRDFFANEQRVSAVP
ncbi:hypothetical protein [Aeromonas jandaei]|uniref:hypothetical protein n=1 Tax=Aeromonas jandaei TaxID=650 RepID=UPI00191CFAEB|nr:hypothetical protein [Aeromonas jandaei]MBL0626875.1 hypothetical protein [Aeromonas jandaei]